jgi:hypothetical protein
VKLSIIYQASVITTLTTCDIIACQLSAKWSSNIGIHIYQILTLLQASIVIAVITLGANALGLPYLGAFGIIAVVLINLFGHLPILYLLKAHPIPHDAEDCELISRIIPLVGSSTINIYQTPFAQRDIALVRTLFSGNILILGEGLNQQLNQPEKKEIFLSSLLLFRSGIIALRTTTTLLFIVALLPIYLTAVLHHHPGKMRWPLYAIYYLLLPIRLLKLVTNRLLSVMNKQLRTATGHHQGDPTLLFDLLSKIEGDQRKISILHQDLLEGISLTRNHHNENPLDLRWWYPPSKFIPHSSVSKR